MNSKVDTSYIKNILVIFGTRPEAIKMAPVVKELQIRDNIKCKVCVTAQHRQMLDQVLGVFGIEPEYDLDIMRENQSLTDISVNAFRGLESLMQKEKPDIVLVHGDTATAFAGAVTAFHNKIAVGHVEAGLRTYNKYSPYPEEMYRQMVDCVTDYYFAPTEATKQNLLNEGKSTDKIYITGNTAIDALRYTVKTDFQHELLDWLGNDRLILMTAHRRENLGEPMSGVFKAIKHVVAEFPDVKVIYPVHLNPAVRETANSVIGNDEHIRLIEPLNVIEFHNIMARAFLILTDSGGIQEEAPSLNKPVLVARDTTERPEGVDSGTLLLVGTDEDNVYSSMERLLTDETIYSKMANSANPYGDGFASRRIADILSSC